MVAKILISPSLDLRISEINKILKEVGLQNPHPDLFYLDSEQKLGIEQTKKIREHLSFKPFQAKGRGVVLEDASNLTSDAQNALLKTLEELSIEALFILGAGNEYNFLPTVLSRCEIIRIQAVDSSQQEDKDYTEDIDKLIKSDTPERFEYIEKLKEREEFLQALVQYFHKNLASHTTSGKVNYMEFSKELLEAEKWTSSNVNIRAILEYLMLIMPKK